MRKTSFKKKLNVYANELSQEEVRVVDEIVANALKMPDIKNAIDYVDQREFKRAAQYQHALLKLSDKFTARKLVKEQLIVTEHLFQIFPEYFTGRLAYVRALENLNHYKDGIKLLETESFRTRKDVWYCYCRLLEKDGQHEKSIVEFENLTQKFSKDTKVLYRYAMVLKDNNYDAKSAVVLEKVLKLSPNHWKALLSLGYFLEKTEGNYESAIEYLKKAFEVAHQNIPQEPNGRDMAGICNQIGIAYANHGEDTMAAKYYNMALEYDPASAAASGLGKLALTDKFIKPGGDGYDAHRKGNSNIDFFKKFEGLRQRNPARFELLHRPSLKEPLVSTISEKKKPEISSVLANAEIPTDDLKEKKLLKPSTKNLYKTKLEEINKILSEQGFAFKQWFQKEFGEKPNGERGWFAQAEARTQSGVYSPAMLEKTLSAMKRKIEQDKINTKEEKQEQEQEQEQEKNIGKREEEILSSDFTQQEMKNPSVKFADIEEKSAEFSLDRKLFLDDSHKTQRFSMRETFWNIVSKCCPSLGQNPKEESKEANKTAKKNN